jgi:hypothetical protein
VKSQLAILRIEAEREASQCGEVLRFIELDDQ